MAAKSKILDIRHGMHLECIYINYNKEPNPYRLYLVYNGRNKYGYYSECRKQLAKYGDFCSVICHVKDIQIAAGWPVDDIIAWNDKYCGN